MNQKVTLPGPLCRSTCQPFLQSAKNIANCSDMKEREGVVMDGFREQCRGGFAL